MGHHGRRRTISLQLHALWIFVRWRKRHQPSHARHLRSLQRHGGLSLECAAKRTTDWKLFTIQRPHRRYLRQPVWGNVFIQGEDGGGASTGLGNHGIETIQDFIARPDTQTSAVPEPAPLLRLPLGEAPLSCGASVPSLICKRCRRSHPDEVNASSSLVHHRPFQWTTTSLPVYLQHGFFR